ncbi:hypothetical protein LX36DRAFT_56872 [Colletotrichum falcatum]|nr:hypothetical protein LX36DRAFT_56872 [Colletotrichum falcatum]
MASARLQTGPSRWRPQQVAQWSAPSNPGTRNTTGRSCQQCFVCEPQQTQFQQLGHPTVSVGCILSLRHRYTGARAHRSIATISLHVVWLAIEMERWTGMDSEDEQGISGWHFDYFWPGTPIRFKLANLVAPRLLCRYPECLVRLAPSICSPVGPKLELDSTRSGGDFGSQTTYLNYGVQDPSRQVRNGATAKLMSLA